MQRFFFSLQEIGNVYDDICRASCTLSKTIAYGAQMAKSLDR